MAYYWTDFSEYEVATGLPADWSEQWSTGSTWSIQSGKFLRHTHTTVDERQATQWDDITDVADVEILAKLRTSGTANSGSYAGVAARIAGAAGTESAMFCRLNVYSTGQKQISFGSYASGTVTTTRWPVAGDVWSANTWYWMRFRVSGTSLQVKVWADGTPEPSSWTTSDTRASPSAAGGVGVHCFTPNANNDWAWFSVATGGDTAPGPDDVMEGLLFNF